MSTTTRYVWIWGDDVKVNASIVANWSLRHSKYGLLLPRFFYHFVSRKKEAKFIVFAREVRCTTNSY